MKILLDMKDVADYRKFLAIKSLPKYAFVGREAEFPDEYAELVTGCHSAVDIPTPYRPKAGLFDYQRDIAAMAIRKKKFAVFAECVAAETVVSGPDGESTISDLAVLNKLHRVWSVDRKGNVVAATASAPWINGVNDLYRFTFASGKSIVATMGHRLMSRHGWKRASEVACGERIAISDASLLASTLGRSRSDCPADDRQNPLIVWDMLAAVEYVRTDMFYDLEVPETGNYLADGVWSHNCGLGKTLIDFEYVRHVLSVLPESKKVMLVCPIMVAHQMVKECRRFYGDTLSPSVVRAAELPEWTKSQGGGRFGITNFEAITDRVEQGNIGCIVVSESSMLKSHYGKWATRLIELGKGLEWKLCETGTPAPNDRIEFANHAVFLDQYPTVNSFLAKFFVNRGMTGERWELKSHALRPFYRDLSHWCIFLSDPSVYGWKDNTSGIPPIELIYHDVELTESQIAMAQAENKSLFVGAAGGFVTRQRMAKIAKGIMDGGENSSHKPAFIASLVAGFGNDQSVVWCRFNDEQNRIAGMIPGAASMDGKTPDGDRIEMVEAFQAGRIKTVVSKPKIMGFGLNLQCVSQMVFSSLQDSYEEFHQAVKRANRYGSTRPLKVHIPHTEIELPMIENVMRKAARIQSDTREQEIIFKECSREFA